MTYDWDAFRVNAIEVFYRDINSRVERIKRKLANLYKPSRIMFTVPFGVVTYSSYGHVRRLRIIRHGSGRTTVILTLGHIGIVLTTPKNGEEFLTVLEGWG